ncbi:hypothetical protein niasHS_011670 [Heterodera schachtii]|uniref:Transcription factor AP-2 C-terminal domain-containing protein n=1 Tax=Heterodera schachtii TaxID=97005 RepID=A0ABD2IQ55_HETSC
MTSPTDQQEPIQTTEAADDEAKSDQHQQTNEEQTKCKKRRIEEKENLGLPIAQSTPLVPGPSRAIAHCQPNQSIVVAQNHALRHSPPPTMAPSPILGHYFPFGPNSADSSAASMFPSPVLYNPWLRWTPTGGLLADGIAIPKPSHLLEPTDLLKERNESSTPAMKNGANLNAAVEQQDKRKDGDSGVGSDDTPTTATTTTTTKLSSSSTWITTDVDGTGTDGSSSSSNSSSSSSQSVVVVMPPASDHLHSSPAILPFLPPISALISTDQQQQLFHPINNYETYCSVPGRLTLLSNQKKYRVSVGEIQRRLAPPECMNASILGGILRKAKNKDGGRLLREQLHMYGVELAVGRRKQSALSCFSSLVEQEAVQLAMDFRTICQRDYPIQAVATHSLADVSNVQDAYIRRMELFYAGKLLNRILDLHKSDQSPTTITEQPKCEPTEQFGADLNLNPEVQAGLAHFSLLTHGFGGHSVQAVLEIMIRVINECNGVLTRKYQSPINAVTAAGQQNAVQSMPFGLP